MLLGDEGGLHLGQGDFMDRKNNPHASGERSPVGGFREDEAVIGGYEIGGKAAGDHLDGADAVATGFDVDLNARLRRWA